MYRFGRPAATHAAAPPVHTWWVACQPLPSFLSNTNPERKPPPVLKLALHGPHQPTATYSVPPTVMASSAVTCDAALPPTAVRVSKILVHDVVPPTPCSEFHTIA